MGESSYWRFEFVGNAFLHHMIRNIMGCLVYVGQGRKTPEWMQLVLEAKNRDAAAPTYAPEGLYFAGPQYDSNWGLPEATHLMNWLV
jgi:tRNA pseudouridine38-40 synthase